MSKSMENLVTALSGEAVVIQKYLTFAEKADKEGKPGVAKLFRATAASEAVHATTCLRLLKSVGKTEDNLRDALEGENLQFKSLYPGMVEDAIAEGEKVIRSHLNFVIEAEKVRARLYSEALDGEETYDNEDFYVCTLCGHTHRGKPTDRCPICKAPKKVYKKID